MRLFRDAIVLLLAVGIVLAAGDAGGLICEYLCASESMHADRIEGGSSVRSELAHAHHTHNDFANEAITVLHTSSDHHDCSSAGSLSFTIDSESSVIAKRMIDVAVDLPAASSRHAERSDNDEVAVFPSQGPPGTVPDASAILRV